MFLDREEAACRLAEQLKGRKLHHPLVLAIPRGGVVTGSVLARQLGAELDVVLSARLRAPGRPELALGAVSENGRVYLDQQARTLLGGSDESLAEERRHQLAELGRRRTLFRAVRPRAAVSGRSVVVTDDGIATGSSMIAALQTIRPQHPRELIVAIPVAPRDRLEEVRRWCDDVVRLFSPNEFWAIGQFYVGFRQVEDEQVLDLLRQAAPKSPARQECAPP
jgi:predicted phosphoribosyltransferase